MSNGNNKVIYYSEYGAAGDGVTDDFDAIVKTHEAANMIAGDVVVRADAGASYYIGATGAADKTAQVQTDTDWGDAEFIIDDSKVGYPNENIFQVSSKLKPIDFDLAGLTGAAASLKKNQAKIDLPIPDVNGALITVRDKSTMRYIREGLNQNNGAAQIDIFLVDKDGNVDMNAPIIWDFDNISSMTAHPIDAGTLTVKGGHFTTIANQAESRYTYYKRGISIMRSNVIIDGVQHVIKGEGEHGAPYSGFIGVRQCADVTVRNCRLSGHKTYVTPAGSAGKPVSMGTYDISVNSSVNVTFKDCTQINDIHDTELWGIFCSNFSKNILFDTVSFSRFDAHMGVANATVKNSVIGHVGLNIIGSGTFLVENTKVCGHSMINLRGDYGSTWEGDVIIRNCEFIPRNGKPGDAVLVRGSYSSEHDFGYTCYMPKKIVIDGLVIDDRNSREGYDGPRVFGEFNSSYASEEFEKSQKYPYVITEEVTVRNLEVKSGKSLQVSSNQFMFRNVKITEK